MKIPSALVLIIALLHPALATGSNGTSSAQFLSLGAGPKAVAMGELGSATSEDSYAAYWNPAGLALVTEPEMALMHNQHFENISQQYLVYAQPVLKQSALAVSLTRLASDPIATYDVNGTRTGSITTSDMSLSLSAAQLLSTSLSLGGSVKWINQDLGAASASTAGFDIGLHWRPSRNSGPEYLKKFKTGLMISNLGPGLKFDTERFNLPTTLRLGIGYEDFIRRKPTVLGAETSLNANHETIFSLGAEHWVTRSMAIRTGYKSAHDFGSGLRLGFGFKIANIMLDYAWAGFGEIGAAHRLGFIIRFGQRQQPRYQIIRGPQNEQLPPLALPLLPTQEASADMTPPAPIQNLPASQETATIVPLSTIVQRPKKSTFSKFPKPISRNTPTVSQSQQNSSPNPPTTATPRSKKWLTGSLILGSAIWLAYKFLSRYR